MKGVIRGRAEGGALLEWRDENMNTSSSACLVSVPEELVFVRRADSSTPESALILAELSREELRYYRCLVDGRDIVEHAIVLEGEAPLSESERERLRRVLHLRRPHVVSFLRQGEDGRLQLSSTEGSFHEAVAVASVVELSVQRRSAGEIWVRADERDWQVSAQLERRLWACRVEPRCE